MENVRDSNPEPGRESSLPHEEEPTVAHHSKVGSKENSKVRQITHMAIKSARGHTEDRSAIKSLILDKKALPSLESTQKSEFKPQQVKYEFNIKEPKKGLKKKPEAINLSID